MPRIRTVKPSFFTSQTVAELPATARLKFIGLWTHADDEGRAVDDPRLIKAAVWPLDDKHTARKVTDDLNVLERHGLIRRYEVAGRRYLHIPSWHEHQKINRPQKSSLPVPPPFTEDSVSTHGAVTEPSPQERTGKEGEGKGKDLLPVAAAPEGGEVVQHSAHRLAADLWESVTPRPSIKFIALRKLIERFIEAGWPEAAVADALRRTRVFTLAGIEFTLRTHHKQVEPQAWEAIRAAMEDAS